MVLTIFLLSLALFTLGCHKEEKPDPGSSYYTGSDFSRAGSAKAGKTGGQ
jgi:hypothetical protein